MNRVLIMRLIAVFFTCSCFAEDNPKMTGDDRSADNKLFEEVASNVVASIDRPSKSDEVIDRLLEGSNDKIVASFCAAKMAWVQNKYDKAVRILENVVEKYGKEKSKQEFDLPVSVIGNYWIAAISSQKGDCSRAIRAYDDLIKEILANNDLIGQVVYCYLSKAELESLALKRKDLALATLEKIKEMNSPFGQGQDKEWAVFLEWTDYQVATLDKNASKVQSSLRGNSLKIEVLKAVADSELFVSGIIARPRSDFYNGKRAIMKSYALHQSAGNKTSSIYSYLSQIHLACLSEIQGNYDQAEKCYQALFDSEFFFAPEGGLLLAKCKLKQGKTDDAKKIYLKINERFPGYSDLVNDLCKDNLSARP